MPAEAQLLELAATLPDRPRWVEARGLLLSGRCDVILAPEGRVSGRTSAGFLVVEHDGPLVCAVKRPAAETFDELHEAFGEQGEILAPIEDAEHLRQQLPGWVARAATIHVHPDPGGLPGPEHEVRFLTPEDAALWELLPPRLARQIARALDNGPCVATLAGGEPVAFASVAYETEAWWDVAVDTLAGHRRRGYASSAAACLIGHMLERGKQPVWGALDANAASLAMAARYGFRAVDRMVLFTAAERRPSPRTSR